MRIYRKADLVEKPWKNGGGITRDIAARQAGVATLWRLSMADVAQSGPFSAYPGLTRVLTVIEGGGMILRMPGAVLHADFAVPVTFDGGDPVAAELTAGPLVDLNLMYDPARCSADARVLHDPAQGALPGGGRDTAVVHCIAGRIAVAGDRLHPGDTAIADLAPLPYRLEPDSIALAISLGMADTRGGASQTERSAP